MNPRRRRTSPCDWIFNVGSENPEEVFAVTASATITCERSAAPPRSTHVLPTDVL